MTKRESKRQPLLARLRHVEAAVPEGRKASVLTPRNTAKPLSRKTKTYTVFLSAETEHKLEQALTEASPFSGPLALTQLVDLLYCEMAKSPDIQERAAEQIKGIGAEPKDRKTSMLLKVAIDRHFTKTFKLSSYSALTKLVQWAASDWGWIKPRLTYSGLSESSQKTATKTALPE